MEKIIALKPSEIKVVLKTQWLNRTIKTRFLCLVGHKGVGKSEIVEQCAAELGIECRIVNLQFCEAPDFLGLPYIDKDGITRHARPSLLPDSGKGLLFLDEVNRCNRDIRQALISLLQARQVNDFKLGKDWTVVMAMNPVEADGISYEVQEFDAALEDRITKIEFKGDVVEFTDYMIKKYTDMHPVVRWILSQPTIVDFKGKTRTVPRGLEYLIARIGVDNNGIASNNKINFNSVAMEVGEQAAVVFQKFLSSEETIRPDDIIDNWNDDLAKKLKVLESQSRTDIITDILYGVCNIVSRLEKADVTPKKLENLMKFAEASSADVKITFFLALDDIIRKVKKFDEAEDFFNLVADGILKNSENLKAFVDKHDWDGVEAKLAAPKNQGETDTAAPKNQDTPDAPAAPKKRGKVK